MNIFLVCGKADSGKSEIAKIIKEYYIYNYKKTVVTGFKKYIKNFVSELTDWDGNELTLPVKDFQEIGNKIREINPEYLINNMMQDITIYSNFVDNVVIKDVRLPEQIDAFKNTFDNVYTIYVENQFKPVTLAVEEQIDITEIALENYSDYDYVVVNHDLNELKDKIFKIMEEIK